MNAPPPNVLTIAGTDPSGGAGIQADLKTFSALGAYGMSVITAVVAQNTHGVREVVTLDPDVVVAQLRSVLEDVRVDAIKLGMLATAPIAEAVADVLEEVPSIPVVLDPVMVATSGDRLISQDTVAVIRERLVPRSALITPNLPEAAVLLGAPAAEGMEQMHEQVDPLLALGPQWLLLKGGHLAGNRSIDVLAGEGHRQELSAPRVDTRNDHGTGCTLSAAVAALRPSHPMPESVAQAKSYLTAALEHSHELDVGSGHGPVHHFHAIWGRPAS